MAEFFYVAKETTNAEVIEFLLRRYSNIDYILNMDVEMFLDFLKVAKEKETEERLHAQWVTMLPAMSKQELKYIPFSDYVDQCTGRNIDRRPAEEIIAELEALHGTKLV